jgi:hypothetical protein
MERCNNCLSILTILHHCYRHNQCQSISEWTRTCSIKCGSLCCCHKCICLCRCSVSDAMHPKLCSLCWFAILDCVFGFPMGPTIGNGRQVLVNELDASFDCAVVVFSEWFFMQNFLYVFIICFSSHSSASSIWIFFHDTSLWAVLLVACVLITTTLSLQLLLITTN